jgi:CBS domain-containing protein
MALIYSGIQRAVASLDQRSTALEAAQLMTERFIGSVVVTDGTRVKGIFTERDLVKRVIAAGRDPHAVELREVMREQSVRVTPRESVERCLELMKQHRCRHLLVFDADECVGIVSLRDLVALMLEEKEQLIQQLTHYITS